MLFFGADGELILSDPSSVYLQKAKRVIDDWDSGVDNFSFFSSGSTGEPKTYVFTRKQILTSVSNTASYFKLTKGDLLLCNLPIDFVAGKMMMLRALALGLDLIVLEPSKNPILDLGKKTYFLKEYRSKVFFAFTPYQFLNILENNNSSEYLRYAKAILLGGAGINEDLLKTISDSGLPVYEGYGMTETLTHIAARKIKYPADPFETLSNITVSLNKKSCLEINYPALSDTKLETNDLAEVYTNKTFIIKGRRDQIINSGGIKLNLLDIESKIRSLNLFNENFFLWGINDAKLGQKLVLIVESKECSIEIADLKKFLGKFEVPKEIIKVDKFIYTPTFKINKAETINEYLST